MDEATFWGLIERSRQQTHDREARADWLTERLAAIPRFDVEDFQLQLDHLRNQVDTWQMWGAATLVFQGWCSDDSFWYFQLWLIGQGREPFERAATDPDALADAPAVARLAGRSKREWCDDEWPGWEELDYVSARAYGDANELFEALKRRGHQFRSSPAPADQRWNLSDQAEADRRYPRLTTLFVS